MPSSTDLVSGSLEVIDLATMKSFALGALAICALAGTAHASTLYQFDVIATGGVDSFSFSFTVPSFVTTGQSPAFTPFNVTDGTHTWTMINDLAGIGAVSCFLFDTGGSSNINSTCGFGVGSAPDGSIELTISGGLPTANGPYSISSGLGILDFSGGEDTPSLSGTLTVTSESVPEPTSIGLLGVGLAAIGWKRSVRTIRAGKRSPRYISIWE